MSYSNINIGKNSEDYEVSTRFDTYGRVDVVMGEDDEGNVITVSYPNIADDQVGGRILTIDMPMCTDSTLALTAATRIYNSLTSSQQTAFQYQPMKATSALLDPSAEFGDGVDINNVHSGFHTRNVQFDQLMKADISSPTDEELNHEYPYQDPQQRQITRSAKEYKAGLYVNAQAISAEVSARTAQGQTFSSQLSVQATQIAARVTKTGGNNSSFGWVLNDTSHTWYSGSKAVMTVTSSGLEVTGKITATSGQIGGFTIGSNSIYSNGMSSMSSSQSYGVHVGTDGIKLGQNFKVDTGGNVTANNMTITGTLKVGGNYISAANLYTGAYQASQNYGGWNDAHASTSYGGYCYSGATNGNDAKLTWDYAQNPNIGVSQIRVGTLSASYVYATSSVATPSLYVGGRGFGRIYDSDLGVYLWYAT